MTLADHAIYGLLWLLFGILHSVLASMRAKDSLSALGRGYRLFYNLFALIHIAVTVYLGEWILGASASELIGGPIQTALYLVGLIGGIVLILGMGVYDGGRFSGVTQLRHPDKAEDEPLRTSGIHRYVRHPLYTGAIMILWARIGSEAEVATAVWATLYFVVGAWFEERRLIVRYGAAYADYRKQVPGFVPWKGRAI